MDNEPYLNFASIYDQIMSAADYEAWADYVEALLNRFDRQPKSIIDLACGTGASTFPFSKRGYAGCRGRHILTNAKESIEESI
ncbi:MAG: class I SAM-dependent methyltransferase [Bacillota bacterium]